MPLADDCVFCKIIKGEIPCARVYEDDQVLAFLDIAPFNFGHTLVIPKEHHHSCTTVPAATLGAMMAVAARIGAALQRAVKAEGFNLFLNNGRCAGQEVPHAHLHVVPRFSQDKPLFQISTRQYEGKQAMQELAAEIGRKLEG